MKKCRCCFISLLILVVLVLTSLRDTCQAAVITQSKTRIYTPSGVVPYSGALAPNGDLYISTRPVNGISRLYKLNSDGNFQLLFSTTGILQAINDEGHFYLLDSANERGRIVSSTGQQIGDLGAGQGEFSNLTSIRIDPYTGEVYAIDNGLDLVKIYSQDGSFQAQFTAGHHPEDIAFTSSGLYVSDATQIYDPYAGWWIDGAGIGVYDREGGHLFSFGTFGWDYNDPNQFEGPTGVTGIVADPYGAVYAGHAITSGVSIFDADGNVLGLTDYSGVSTIMRLESSNDGKIYVFNLQYEFVSVLQYNWPLADVPDSDGDWYPDAVDNCPLIAGSQTDSDADGIGDICDQSTCGNSILEPLETCDDGNTVSGDGCSAVCLSECIESEICGDGRDNNCDGLADDSDPACAGCRAEPMMIGSQFSSDLVQYAYEALALGSAETIRLQAMTIGESLVFDRNVIVTLKGGYDCFFNEPPAGTTVVSSPGTTVTVSAGTVIVDGLILR